MKEIKTKVYPDRKVVLFISSLYNTDIQPILDWVGAAFVPGSWSFRVSSRCIGAKRITFRFANRRDIALLLIKWP